MHVNRRLPEQEDTVIVPGNNKLRIMQRLRGRCYGILKDQFPPDRFLRELDARTTASKAGVHVPQLLERNDKEGWFCEQYIAATPINRLAESGGEQTAILRAAVDLGQLLQATAGTEQMDCFVDGRVAEMKNQIEDNRLIEKTNKTRLRFLTDQLAQRTLDGPLIQVTTALTHGDFQAANVLVENGNIWIIDWEYASRRSADFDLLTYITGARSPTGLAQRLIQLTEQPDADQRRMFDVMKVSQFDWTDRSSRQCALNLFLLEELSFHLHENDNPLFVRLNHGFHSFVEELSAWLAT